MVGVVPAKPVVAALDNTSGLPSKSRAELELIDISRLPHTLTCYLSGLHACFSRVLGHTAMVLKRWYSNTRGWSKQPPSLHQPCNASLFDRRQDMQTEPGLLASDGSCRPCWLSFAHSFGQLHLRSWPKLTTPLPLLLQPSGSLLQHASQDSSGQTHHQLNSIRRSGRVSKLRRRQYRSKLRR